MIRLAALVTLVLVVGSALAFPLLPEAAPLRPAVPAASPSSAGDPFAGANGVPMSLVIRNDGDEDDRLLGGTTPAGRRIVLHRTELVGGRRVMRRLNNGLVVPAGGTLLLEPGADHLMLVDPRVALVQGATFPLTLTFARAGDITVTARVRRKVDAAGVTPFPPVAAGDISVSLASAPPAPAGTPVTAPTSHCGAPNTCHSEYTNMQKVSF